MPEQTTNYDLNKPREGSLGWDSQVNENIDTISEALSDTREDIRTTEQNIEDTPTTEYLPRGYNMGFDNWQRGLSFDEGDDDKYGPDHWLIEDVTSTFDITQEDGDTDFDSTYRVKIVGAIGAACALTNWIPFKHTHSDFHKFCAGKKVTFALDIKKVTAANVVEITIGDGNSEAAPTTAAANTSLQRLVVTHTVHATLATTLYVKIEYAWTANTETSVANASFAVGDYAALPYIPNNPQDDMLGCYAIYQKMSLSIGYYDQSGTADLHQVLYYPAPMLGMPAAAVTTGTKYGDTGADDHTLTFIPIDGKHGYTRIVRSGVATDHSYGFHQATEDTFIELTVS